jgi:hypothetical protein
VPKAFRQVYTLTITFLIIKKERKKTIKKRRETKAVFWILEYHLS